MDTVFLSFCSLNAILVLLYVRVISSQFYRVLVAAASHPGRVDHISTASLNRFSILRNTIFYSWFVTWNYYYVSLSTDDSTLELSSMFPWFFQQWQKVLKLFRNSSKASKAHFPCTLRCHFVRLFQFFRAIECLHLFCHRTAVVSNLNYGNGKFVAGRWKNWTISSAVFAGDSSWPLHNAFNK